VRRRLDHDKLRRAVATHLDHGVAGFAKPRREGRDLPFRRVEAPDGAVVGVADGHRAVGQHGDAEGMLQQGQVSGAVAVPEVEQALPDMRFHDKAVIGQVERAECRGLGVGDPQPAAVRRHIKAGRLGEPGLVRHAVADALRGGPPKDGHGVLCRIGGKV
jgi:hypothetical protein